MKAEQKQQNNFDEVQYFADVAKIRSMIAKLLKKHDMIDKEALIPTFEVNPYFGRITKNGAFGVEFSYGYPNAIYTPCGKVRIGIPPMNENIGNYLDQENFFKDMQKKFGMVMVEPGFKKEFVGEFGPYYAITRLPWKKDEKFPARYERVKGNLKEDSKRFEVFEEVRRANALLEQANEVIARLGVDAKKSKCIIGKERIKTNTIEMGL